MRPYFPGYMFVRTSLADTGPSAFAWMPFGQGLVAFGGEPAAVPEALIVALQRRVAEINAAGGEQLAGLEQGDIVTIRGGPFEGHQAIFDARIAGSERVRVLLQLLQARQVKVDLPVGQIEKTKRR